jgi:hypothetical protein
MWGHGFVCRYFEGFALGVRIKRLLCPGCGMVVCFRPQDFFPKFQSSIADIYNALKSRLGTGFWPYGFKRQRGWYWLKLLMKTVVMNAQTDPVQFLSERLAKGVHFFV